ncbi:MAG: hypothetical protein ACOYNY_25520, partial [Caldilineaceae bacterium]
MNVPRLFKRNPIRWRTLHKAVTICILASLLAGLIPPPLVRSVLPAPAADLAAAALLPTIPAAQAAADAAPVANPVAMPVAAPVEAPAAAPLAQGVSGSNVLTVTKSISGTGSGPFN